MRILKWALVLLLLTQLPFCYKVWQSHRLSSFLSSPVRTENRRPAPYQDWRGAIHVHSASGGHSLGMYTNIIAAAKQLDLDYVFITEHLREKQLLQPLQDPKILLIYGWEKQIEEGFAVLTDPEGDLNLIADFEGESIPEGFDGIEIYSLHENGRTADSWFNRFNFLYHLFAYSDLFYFQLFDLDRERIRLWERSLAFGHLTGFSGTDAHQNVGVILQTAAGQKIATILVDPYVNSLGFATTHLLAPRDEKISEEAVVGLIRSGSAYVSFEQIGDPTGFSFHAVQNGSLHPMGSEVKPGADLVVQAPIAVRFQLFKSGQLFRELEGTRFVVEKADTGIYRVEVFVLDPPSLLVDKPWILSNPIYVR